MNSLQAALGLPLHNIFDGGIYNEYLHSKTDSPDVEDTDHVIVEPPLPIAPPTPPSPFTPSPSTPTPIPTPMPTLLAVDTDRDW